MIQWFVVITLVFSSLSLVESCSSSKAIYSCGVTKNMQNPGSIQPDLCSHIILSKFDVYVGNLHGDFYADILQYLIPTAMNKELYSMKKKNKKLKILFEVHLSDEEPKNKKELQCYKNMDEFFTALWNFYPVDGIVVDSSSVHQDKVDKLFAHLSQQVKGKGKTMWLRGHYQDNSLNPSCRNYNESFDHVIMEMKKTPIIKTDENSFGSELDDIVQKWTKLGFSKTQMIMEYSMQPMAYEIDDTIDSNTVRIKETSGTQNNKGDQFQKDVQKVSEDDRLTDRMNVVLKNSTNILIINDERTTANKVLYLSEKHDLHNFHIFGFDEDFRRMREFYTIKGLIETELL